MIVTERQGRVLVVTIDRPERRNALDAAHLLGLQAACAEAAEVPARPGDDVRSLVLRGTGSAFCAGADLSHVEDAEAAALVRATLDALSSLPICTVAAVHGPALGGGCQLAMACDLRMVDTGARFGIPSSKLGVMVDHWTIEKLALLAGHSTARAILLAAEVIDAEAALRIGFAQRSGTPDDAVAWAGEIAGLAPLSVAGQKLALDRLSARVEDDPEVRAIFERVWSSDDRVEGITAFGEKRPAEFQGR